LHHKVRVATALRGGVDKIRKCPDQIGASVFETAGAAADVDLAALRNDIRTGGAAYCE
jgi:hypothetical protein